MARSNLLFFAYTASILGAASLADCSMAQELQVPVYFSLYVSEQHELYEFAPPHPCGRVLALRANKVPQDLSIFKVFPAIELNEDGENLAMWPLPVDAVPTGIKNDRLSIRLSVSQQTVFLSTSGNIGLPVEGDWPEQSTDIGPDHRDCPASAESLVSQYFCAVLTDQADGQTRIIGYPPICT